MADRSDIADPQGVQPDGTSAIILFGPYRLIASLRRLERAGQPVPLGDREFDLLCTLIARAGEIVFNRELRGRIGARRLWERESSDSTFTPFEKRCPRTAWRINTSRRSTGAHRYVVALPAAKAIAHSGMVTSSMRSSHRCERICTVPSCVHPVSLP
jgi:hypothetical protein